MSPLFLQSQCKYIMCDVCMYVCMYVMYVCMYVCMYVSFYIPGVFVVNWSVHIPLKISSYLSS